MKVKITKHLIFVLMMACILFFAACTGNNAEELYETAQFEELQNNQEHAEQLYEEIIKKYPESEYTKKAEDRLSELRK